MPPVTASTRLIALLGDPVGHSLSPVFQNAAFEDAGLDAVYLALRAGAGDLPALLRAVALAGGAGNVTVPHKQLAIAALDDSTDAVRSTGACNTFWCDGGRVWGDNTDVAGFRAAARSLMGQEPSGARVLLLGAGGAARAVIVALAEAGAAEVRIRNRTRAAAEAMVETMGGMGVRLVVESASPVPPYERYDLIVNATSLGLRDGDPRPLPIEDVAGGTPVLDLVYRPGETEWVRALRVRGHPAADGAEMLLQQGAAAFERWWGRGAPLAVMRDALAR
jgi:shikimate dehydrogenase